MMRSLLLIATVLVTCVLSPHVHAQNICPQPTGNTICNQPPAVNIQPTDLLLVWQLNQTPQTRSASLATLLNTPPLVFTESGSVANPVTWANSLEVGTDYSTYNFTNLTTPQKRGAHTFVATTAQGTVSVPVQVEGYDVYIYSPSGVNNGVFGSSTTVAESSGIIIRQTGGGNALTAYDLAANRPTGYHNYTSDGVSFQGFAIETGCDGIRTCFWSEAFSAGGQAGNIGWTTTANGVPTPSYGIIFFPSGTCNRADRAVSFQTSVFVEKAYVDDCGNASFVSMNNLSFFNAGSVAPVLTGCTGTGGVLAANSTKNSGSFVVGAGGTSCTVTFPTNSFRTQIFCRVTSQNTNGAVTGFQYNYILSAMSISGTTNFPGDNIDYQCDGA